MNNLQTQKFPTTIIKGNPNFKRNVGSTDFLKVSEFFCNTIQGENFVGYPCTFLRLQSCTLNCVWCDTKEVWRYGNPYTLDELFELMKEYDVISNLREGQHLVFTGGSPLLQQEMIIKFIQKFQALYHFKPFIEIENECTIMPMPQMISFVNIWNNSPKLSSSGNLTKRRYITSVLKKLSSLQNSWFKFVITSKDDWDEIGLNFIINGLIKQDQVVLMPCGSTREELIANQQMTVEMAIKHNVRYTSREHIMLWGK
jgi:organic radical activating enzyme